jgi:hypothetical protein
MEENNMNSMNMPEKIEAKKRVVSSFCFYFSQFFLFVSTKLLILIRFKLVYLRDYSVVFYFYFTFH